jgi:ABC-type multidrug transport system ATPase subunit
MMQEIVHTYGLTKKYKEVTVVNQLDMVVERERVYGFLGPNGAGKSTTLKMLLGLATPTAVEIDLFGKRFQDKNRMEVLKQIGSLIETPSYYGHLTGRENLKIIQTILNVPASNVDEVLKIVRLTSQQNKKVSAYSLGMKQRLGLASALLGFPKLLILDEPTNGLDPAGIQEMRELICSLPKKYGMTVIVSSHLLSEIDQMAEDIGIIANGKLMFQGTLPALHQLDPSKNLEEIFLDLTGREASL